MELVEQETGEDHGYISPGGQRFTYAAADMKTMKIDSFDHNSNIHVQFTSNREDYMQRGCFDMSWWGSPEVK